MPRFIARLPRARPGSFDGVGTLSPEVSKLDQSGSRRPWNPVACPVARTVDFPGGMHRSQGSRPVRRLAVALALALALLAACSRPSVLVQRPANAEVDAAVTALWSAEIARVARDGDWILTRSYFVIGDAIVKLTPGEELSHASIYDARTQTVIEAVGDGVREIPLGELVQRNHYVIVVRPANMTAADGQGALVRARGQLGKKFDIGGMFGLDHGDRFYCSELVYWASQTEARSGTRERVVTPADLMKYGEVVYWSGKRDDPQVMALATAR
jgi:hypothetical protein